MNVTRYDKAKCRCPQLSASALADIVIASPRRGQADARTLGRHAMRIVVKTMVYLLRSNHSYYLRSDAYVNCLRKLSWK